MNSVIKNSNNPPRTIQFAEFSFDAEKRVLWRGGETVSLAPKACELPTFSSKTRLMFLRVQS